MYKWSEEWNMLFNMDKCAVMHVGRKNRGFEYEMGDRKLRTTEEEKDLGVKIHRKAQNHPDNAEKQRPKQIRCWDKSEGR